jgi:alkaline phosphatase
MKKSKYPAYMKRPLIILSVFVILFFNCLLYSRTDEENTEPVFDVNDFSFYMPAPDISPYPLIKQTEVRNVIFLIGDGMGLNQIAAARIKAAGMDGKLYLEKMPVTGIVRTHSANNAVTDSAAAGTALACGIKTNNDMVGMAPDGSKYLNIFEAAQKTGMKTAIIVTSEIYHATPACFCAHIRDRWMYARIAEQVVDSKINILFGGGKTYFLPKGLPDGRRRDNKNLIKKAEENGYKFVETKQQLDSADGKYLLGLFEPNGLTTRPPEPSIADLTKKAVQILDDSKKKPALEDFLGRVFTFSLFDNDKGFFMMVEGSQIDQACHKNNVNACIRQTLLFDLAVKEAIDFAVKDRHTLVIVTADHETRGLTIAESKKNSKIINYRWAIDANTPYFGPTDGHTGQPVAVFAFGPGAQNFCGVYDNTDIPRKIAKLLNLKLPQRLK